MAHSEGGFGTNQKDGNEAQNFPVDYGCYSELGASLGNLDLEGAASGFFGSPQTFGAQEHKLARIKAIPRVKQVFIAVMSYHFPGTEVSGINRYVTPWSS